MLISIGSARVLPLLRAISISKEFITMATEAQINANRENAQKSTGPTSESGKSRVSLNAVKTGLTARIMLLSAEDAPIYQKHLDRW